MQGARTTFHYNGNIGGIFKLALVTAFLTLVTLGIYRFWAKTRIRRYIWSNTRLGGEPFEYTGTGIEKFLGFLIAVVFLAVYLGIIQMLLFYFGFVVFTEPRTQAEALAQIAAIYISFFALVPFILFAVYRARRYKMARTRWRGIRFGMDKGAWGYVARAIGYWLLTIVSLGILTPLRTFRLEQYMAERSWFGDAKLHQEGKWTDLYRMMKHLFIGIGILVLAGIFAAMQIPVLFGILAAVGYVWVIVGGIHYSVQSFAYLTSNKVIDGNIRFTARPSTWEVIKTYLIGSLIIGVGGAVAFGIIGGVFWGVMQSAMLGGEPPILSLILIALLYVAFLLVAGAAAMALIVQPILGHYITTIEVENIEAVDTIRQRIHDSGADAEGFADALDIGGAI